LNQQTTAFQLVGAFISQLKLSKANHLYTAYSHFLLAILAKPYIWGVLRGVARYPLTLTHER
ncbi:MAG: hypothetical protein RJA25_196, partial [Bacteroidota bacterium]